MANPKWFDADVYMQNKLVQLKAQDPEGGWTLDKVYNAFRDAGFVGTEGAVRALREIRRCRRSGPQRLLRCR